MNQPCNKEDVLSTQRLAQPAPALRERVLRSARYAWEDAASNADDVPWAQPVLRLAASLAFAALLVWSAGRIGPPVTKQDRPQRRVDVSPYPELYEGTVHATIATATRAMPNPATAREIIDYQRQLRKMLSSND